MKQTITTETAPRAIGPYAQAIGADGWVFCSGQIALDPGTGCLRGDGEVAAETRQVLANLSAVLAAAGCTSDDVVKTTIFLTDLEDFATVNEIYGAHFSSAPPARSTVEVSRLPLGARVEIEAVAMRPQR